MAQYGMVFDLTSCMNCGACMIACKTEHQISTGKHNGNEYFRMSLFVYEKGKYPAVKRVYTPILCMQCENAPCLDVCPLSGAIYRREDGIVAINKDKCDGCKLCMRVCPYNALYFDEETIVVDKCDFCANRLDQNLEPACVGSCMAKAITFGDLDDSDSEVSMLLKRNDIKPDRQSFPPYFNQNFKPRVYYIQAIGVNIG